MKDSKQIAEKLLSPWIQKTAELPPGFRYDDLTSLVAAALDEAFAEGSAAQQAEADAGILYEAVKTVNAVQNLIGRWMNPNGSLGSDLYKAWNLNARFLSENFSLQNRYLAENPDSRETMRAIDASMRDAKEKKG